jgi:DNA-binding NarL/FixJ family response regulator
MTLMVRGKPACDASAGSASRPRARCRAHAKRAGLPRRIAGLLLGADDYLVKPFDPDELIARARCFLRHRSIGVTAADGVPPNELIAELTPREQEVLALLASGYSSAQVAHELVISPRTVGTHVQHILSKLGVSSRTQAVAFAHHVGLADVVEHSLVVQRTAAHRSPQMTKPSS